MNQANQNQNCNWITPTRIILRVSLFCLIWLNIWWKKRLYFVVETLMVHNEKRRCRVSTLSDELNNSLEERVWYVNCIDFQALLWLVDKQHSSLSLSGRKRVRITEIRRRRWGWRGSGWEGNCKPSSLSSLHPYFNRGLMGWHDPLLQTQGEEGLRA